MDGQAGIVLDQLFYGFDTAAYIFFWQIQNSLTLGIADVCQYMGNSAAYIFCFVISLFLCFPKKTRKYGAAMLAAFLVSLLLVNILLKPGVGRLRPYITLQNTPFWETYNTHWLKAGAHLEDDMSFPSGHTSLNFAIFTALASVLSKEKKKRAWILLIIPIIVGITRILRCVHYPSDVVAGMIFGITAGLIGYLIARRLVLRQRP